MSAPLVSAQNTSLPCVQLVDSLFQPSQLGRGGFGPSRLDLSFGQPLSKHGLVRGPVFFASKRFQFASMLEATLFAGPMCFALGDLDFHPTHVGCQAIKTFGLWAEGERLRP